MNKPIRQGDLVLTPTTFEVAVKGNPGTKTLAVGEESAHSHVIDNSYFDPALMQLRVLDGGSSLRVDPPAMSWRHNSIEVPAGDYDIVIQREYTPERIRNVAD